MASDGLQEDKQLTNEDSYPKPTKSKCFMSGGPGRYTGAALPWVEQGRRMAPTPGLVTSDQSRLLKLIITSSHLLKQTLIYHLSGLMTL